MQRILEKIAEVGVLNTFLGMLKYIRYRALQKKMGFDEWHVRPYEFRKYAQAVAEYINKDTGIEKCVVDIGCGMGEILTHIRHGIFYGYDLEEAVIRAAKRIHNKKAIFRYGSFDELCECPEGSMKIDYMITLNFMHGSREESWKSAYTKLCEIHDVRHFIVDVHPEGFEGAHKLDFTKILPECYNMVSRQGPFQSGKYIEVYSKSQN